MGIGTRPRDYHITINLRVIHNAWRPNFKHVQCLWHNGLGKVVSVVHTLIWRYMPDLNVEEIIGNIRFFSSRTIVRLFGNDYL